MAIKPKSHGCHPEANRKISKCSAQRSGQFTKNPSLEIVCISTIWIRPTFQLKKKKEKEKLVNLFSKPCKVMLYSAKGSVTMQHLLEAAKFQSH